MTEEKLSFSTHFKELRRVLLVSFGAVIAFSFLVYFLLRQEVMDLLTLPLSGLGMHLIFTGVSEAFLAYIKVSVWGGFVLASPILIWQALSFVLPGLYAKEKKRLFLALGIGTGLFLFGLVFGYMIVLPQALRALLFEFAGDLTSYLTIGNYLGFVMKFLIPFGLVFEIPLVIYVLSDLGLVHSTQMTQYRKYVLIVLLILAAILTPPDAISQIMLATPMLLLYEAGILIARWVEKRKPSPLEE